MMSGTKTDWVAELSKTLFWDVDRTGVDGEKHLRWILERVLERGEYTDWLTIKNNVSPDRLREELPRLRIGPKSINFFKRYLHAIDSSSK